MAGVDGHDAGQTVQLDGGKKEGGQTGVADNADSGIAVSRELQPCASGLAELFAEEAIQPPAAASGAYFPAELSLRQALDRSVRALLAADVTGANQTAEQAGYGICRTDDGTSPVVVWRPLISGEGHAVFAWRESGARPLIVEAPHAWHDIDTEIQAFEIFVGMGARALITSGTRRCASLAASPCDGYTSACTGLPIRYTESDAAHNTEMFFHAAHVALSESFAGDTVLSLHGFSYPGVSVSNGTNDSPADGSFHIRLVAELTAALPAETITSCQDYPGAPYQRRMCGGENVQGRHLNGSSDPCTQNAVATSDRFVHMEQSRAVRDRRDAVLQAVDRALGP